MKYLISTCLLACCLSGCGNEGDIHASAYLAKMAQFEQNPAPAGSTIFVGDSIIDNWGSGVPFGMVNRGIGMDTVFDVVNRLPVHLKNDQPSRVVLLIGINGIEHSAEGWLALVEIIKAHPEVQWYVVSLLPNTWNSAGFVPGFNSWLRDLVAGLGGVTFIDAYKLFVADSRYGLLFVDGLHPSKDGYLLLTEALQRGGL